VDTTGLDRIAPEAIENDGETIAFGGLLERHFKPGGCLW